MASLFCGFDVYLAPRREDDVFVIATGETVVRKQLWEKLAAQGIPLETLVSPEVYLDEFDTLHPGCVLTEGTILGGNNTFGLCSYVNLGCKIGHNASLGAFSVLSPGCIVSGSVTIGDGTYIGTGAAIRDEVTIGKNCIIGMGSLVTKKTFPIMWWPMVLPAGQCGRTRTASCFGEKTNRKEGLSCQNGNFSGYAQRHIAPVRRIGLPGQHLFITPRTMR